MSFSQIKVQLEFSYQEDGRPKFKSQKKKNKPTIELAATLRV